MAQIIALAGKGGTGKTTTAALLIRYLLRQEQTPILAVDADPNMNLNELLGLKVELTLGDVKNELLSGVPQGMARSDFMDLRLNEAIVEADGFDLISLGLPEGPGCYCAAHSFLAQSLEKLIKNYPQIIVDNEAGMEHLSRLNLRNIDHLLIVSDASKRGVMTAGRIADLIKPLRLAVKQVWLLVNRSPKNVPSELDTYVRSTCAAKQMQFLGYLPESLELVEAEITGQSFLNLPDELEVIQCAQNFFANLLK